MRSCYVSSREVGQPDLQCDCTVGSDWGPASKPLLILAGMAKVKAVSGPQRVVPESQDNALELGRSTRFSAREVAALRLEFSKLGFTAGEITKVTGATLNLAQAQDLIWLIR